MPDEKVCFMFAISAEGTQLLKEGTLKLSSGGLRNADGSLYEMATPVFFDLNSIKEKNENTEEIVDHQLIENVKSLDQVMKNQQALKEIAWIDYAMNRQTYEMTYQGFQEVVGQLNDIAANLLKAEKKDREREYNERLERVNGFLNKLKSIAGFMEIKNFNASAAYLQITSILDEVAAYFSRLHKELNTKSINEQIVLVSIIILIGPYSYVIRRYSALYYYENDNYPSNYQTWVESISKIVNEEEYKKQIEYYLRVNTESSLEDLYIARNKMVINTKGYIKQINFDHAYVESHTKEEYLSIGQQLQNKIEAQDYKIVEGHICVEL